MEALNAEKENLRALLRWALAGGDVALGLDTLTAIYWWLASTTSAIGQPEGRRWLEQLLALPADFPPPRTAEDQRSTLPTPLTSLVGREGEVAEVVGLLDAARLVTDAHPPPGPAGGPGPGAASRGASGLAAPRPPAMPRSRWRWRRSPQPERRRVEVGRDNVTQETFGGRPGIQRRRATTAMLLLADTSLTAA